MTAPNHSHTPGPVAPQKPVAQPRRERRNLPLIHSDEFRVRLIRSAILLQVILTIGTFGYYILGQGQWDFIDCLYMTMITLTTVGFNEVLPVHTVEGGRLFTLFLIVTGMGTVLYFVSSFTAFFVEVSIQQVLGKRRLMKNLQTVSDHVIVCGIGKTGQHVVDELVQIGRRCVALDQDPDLIDYLRERYGEKLMTLTGDATDDDDLLKAGVDRARAIVVSMGSDVENLYCTLTARQLNPSIHIVATSDDPRAEQKLRHAGANSVVYTAVIGGQRIASEIVRPEVVSFLDLMMRDPEHTLRFEQLDIPEGSPVCGSTLAMSGIRKEAEVLVVATQDAETRRFHYNPGPSHQLEAGETLIVLGDYDEIRKARKFVTGRAGSSIPIPVTRPD